MKLLIALLSFITIALCHSAGPADCFQPGSPMTPPTTGTNGGFAISIGSSYTAGQVLTGSITSTGKLIKGFIIYAETSTSGRAGTFASSATGTGSVVLCDPTYGTGTSLGHRQQLALSTLPFTWTAPSTGEGNVNFKGAVVVSFTESYLLNAVTVTGPGAAPTTGSSSEASINQIAIFLMIGIVSISIFAYW